MAINAFGRGRDSDYEGQSSSNPSTSSSSSASGGLTAFIDQGSEFEGKLSFRDTVRIDGRFNGEITSENTLIVGESGEIDAEIRSKTVVVSGTVNGNVIAEAKVVLHKTAKVNGDIQTPSIVVEEGAIITGKINMSGKSSQKSAGLKAVDAKSDANAKSNANAKSDASGAQAHAAPTRNSPSWPATVRPGRLRDALDDVSFPNAVRDMHAYLLPGFRDLDRLVVEFQPVERLIEIRGVSTKMHGVSGANSLRPRWAGSEIYRSSRLWPFGPGARAPLHG